VRNSHGLDEDHERTTVTSVLILKGIRKNKAANIVKERTIRLMVILMTGLNTTMNKATATRKKETIKGRVREKVRDSKTKAMNRAMGKKETTTTI